MQFQHCSSFCPHVTLSGFCPTNRGFSSNKEPKNFIAVQMLQEDWGELYTGKKAPALFVLDLGSWKVQGLKGTPPESSVGQPVWSPTGIF